MIYYNFEGFKGNEDRYRLDLFVNKVHKPLYTHKKNVTVARSSLEEQVNGNL